MLLTSSQNFLLGGNKTGDVTGYSIYQACFTAKPLFRRFEFDETRGTSKCIFDVELETFVPLKHGVLSAAVNMQYISTPEHISYVACHIQFHQNLSNFLRKI
jgi:hypothetical protein